MFLGLGGYNMLSQQACIGPVYCRARSGDCCLLVLTRRGMVCPVRCSQSSINRQDEVNEGDEVPDGYNLLDIFQVTFASYLVSSLLFIKSPSTSPAISIIPTTTPTTSTTAQSITLGRFIAHLQH